MIEEIAKKKQTFQTEIRR